MDDPGCAFLRLSVPIKTDHYKVCQDARILSLAPLYQAKLGWMVGHTFSRVGTDDWVPAAEPKEDFDKRLSDLLDKYCRWIEPKRLSEAKKDLPPELLASGHESIRGHIQGITVHDLMEEVITAVLFQLKKLGIGTEELVERKIKARLSNDGVLAKLRKLQTWNPD